MKPLFSCALMALAALPLHTAHAQAANPADPMLAVPPASYASVLEQGHDKRDDLAPDRMWRDANHALRPDVAHEAAPSPHADADKNADTSMSHHHHHGGS